MADLKNDIDGKAHFTYIWTIENISRPCVVESPIITVQTMENTKWYLEINFEMLNYNYLALFRTNLKDGPDSIEIKYELSITGIDGLPLIKKVGINKFSSKKDKATFESLNKEERIFRKRDEFLPNDALTVRCRMWRIGAGNSYPDTCFARTLLKSNRRNLIWAIREFSTLQRGEKRQLLLKANSYNLVNLKLFLREEDDVEYLCITLEESSNDYKHQIKNMKFSLLDNEGNVAKSEERRIFKDLNFNYLFEIGKLRANNQSLLSNDVLLLRCEILMSAEIIWSRIENCLVSPQSHVIATDLEGILSFEQDGISNEFSSFTGAIKSLFEDGTLSDVILQTNTKSFPAHKCILSARSPVFKSMFSSAMKEKTSKCIEIPDIEEKTLKLLLSYIYTDTIGQLQWQDAADLYVAADKYELLDLKKKCASFLKIDLSGSSICAVLTIADMHHDQELREAAEDKIIEQDEEFFTSDAWKNLKKNNFKLYVEILERYFLKYRKKLLDDKFLEDCFDRLT